MFNRRRKFESNPGLIKPESRLLRLLRSDTGFQAPLIGLERADQEDGYNEAQKQIRNTILEAEYKKAKAIMMMQQQRRNYC